MQEHGLYGVRGIQGKRNYKREVAKLSKYLRKTEAINRSLVGNLKVAQKKINSQAFELRLWRVSNIIWMCTSIASIILY